MYLIGVKAVDAENGTDVTIRRENMEVVSNGQREHIRWSARGSDRF